MFNYGVISFTQSTGMLDRIYDIKEQTVPCEVGYFLPPNPRKHATLPVNVTVSVPLYGPVPKTLIAQTEDVLVDRRATYNNRQQSGRLDSEIRRKMKPVSNSRSLVSTSR
jgi:hypothetical protein